MADFVRKNWQCEDVITADDLNRLEGGWKKHSNVAVVEMQAIAVQRGG